MSKQYRKIISLIKDCNLLKTILQLKFYHVVKTSFPHRHPVVTNCQTFCNITREFILNFKNLYYRFHACKFKHIQNKVSPFEKINNQTINIPKKLNLGTQKEKVCYIDVKVLKHVISIQMCIQSDVLNIQEIIQQTLQKILLIDFLIISLLHLWPGFLLFMLLFRIIFCYILQCLKKNLKTLLVLLHFFTIKNFWAIGFVNCDMVYKVLTCKESLKEFTKLSNYLILFSYCLVNVLCFEAQIFFYFMVILSR